MESRSTHICQSIELSPNRSKAQMAVVFEVPAESNLSSNLSTVSLFGFLRKTVSTSLLCIRGFQFETVGFVRKSLLYFFLGFGVQLLSALLDFVRAIFAFVWQRHQDPSNTAREVSQRAWHVSLDRRDYAWRTNAQHGPYNRIYAVLRGMVEHIQGIKLICTWLVLYRSVSLWQEDEVKV